MNTFLNVILSKSRVIGARDVAAVFRAASDPRLKNQRKYMARSHIFFRVVHVDSEKAEQQKKNFGALLRSTLLPSGKMGVRGFLYFAFSVKGPNGDIAHCPYPWIRPSP